MMPRSRVSAPAVIVAVDEKSLAQLGQWPWPRTLIARVFDRLAEYHPRAVGVDVIFAEADRLSPGAIAENNPHVGHALALQLKRLLSNDDALAAAIKRLPVVLGVAGIDEPGKEAPPRSAAVFQLQGDPLPYLWHFPSALTSLKQIDAAAASRALLSADIRHGVVRRVPARRRRRAPLPRSAWRRCASAWGLRRFRSAPARTASSRLESGTS
jgi:hypothetical protein